MNINISKKHLNPIAYALIAVAIIASLFLAGQRMNIEKDYNQVEIMVNYTELVSLARANNLEITELADLLKAKGLTGVLVKEISLGDLERSGEVQIKQGQEISLSPSASSLDPNVPLLANNVIIAIHNKDMEEQIVKHLEYKVPGLAYYPGEVSALVIPVNLPNSDAEKNKIYKDITDLGVGFENSQLEKLTDLGLTIIPQVRDWKSPTHESLLFIAEEIKKLPNISILMFNDEQVPGYPDKFKTLADQLKIDGEIYTPIGVVEFFNQRGINNIAAYLNKETVRVHSIAQNEMINYTPDTALDRFELAVTERNHRGLFVRFFGMDRPAAALETNLAYFDNLKDRLEGAGFTIEAPVKQYQSPTYSIILVFLIGLGVIGGAVLAVNNKDWTILALIALVFGTLGWSALLYISPIMARKLMALASVIVFPTLAFLLIVKERSRTIIQSIVALLQMSLISWIGALLMIGLLADKLFMLKLDQFVGVKIAHVLPLVLVLILMHKFQDHPVREAKNILMQPITYLVAGLAGVLVLALGIYVIRTGNVDSNLVLGIEQQMRDALNELLGVRPRTKEFLIGHPFTLLLLYLGITRYNWPLLIPAVIGQVSLVNTYAHIHTPIIISLIRSFNGLWIGVIFGILAIVAWKLAEKYLNDVL
ncbi:MAG: hypothetical protein GX923_06750 [Clostridia bacterium]|nr:hypothetical protein [Clostridia bacterium]